jgi:peptide/nickel transport system permease protein
MTTISNKVKSTIERISSSDSSGSGLKNPSLVIGGTIAVFMLTLSLVGPAFTAFGPAELNPVDRLEPPSALSESNSEYLLGTDQLGRDLLTRTLVGGRISLFLGVSSALLGLLVGVPLGMTSGYVGGTVDEVVMRLLDALMSFPALLLALLILTSLSPSSFNAVVAVAIAFVPRISRMIRSSTLSIAKEEYVKAAEARGESALYIIFREILPNVWSVIMVEGTIRIGYAILIISSLSFLGLGPQPPTPEWGVMVSQARNHTSESIWYLLWPSLALATSITGFNMLGDGLRDLLDPKTMDGE